MRKVLIGTPAHDGRVDVWYCNSLVNTIKLAANYSVQVDPIYMAYDSLVQRARNDLVRLALEGNYDDLIFIDSDQEWNPEWVFQLLSKPVDVVGAPVVKKSDNESYNIKMLPTGLVKDEHGLMEVAGVGTGMLRLSRPALEAVWAVSEPYTNEGRDGRWVFDVRIVAGELVSEDNIICHKWRETGGKVFVDPSMTCSHVGIKKYTGNFEAFLRGLNLVAP